MLLSSELAAPPTSTAFPALMGDQRQWRAWLSHGMSAALLVAIFIQFRHIGVANLWHDVPRNPLFWLGLVAYYLALPASEWVIFRRLWNLPAAGFAALLRKLVSNEILLGYSGELSFYAWARRHKTLTTAPFGAIKDVSILSALAGNLVTLAMTAIAWPFLGLLNIGALSHGMLVSTAVVIVMATLVAVFARRAFSLPRHELRFIFTVHIARLAATTLLSGMIWHVALPDVSIGMLVLLAALQLLVTRLPFVPSKDLMFASLSLALIGRDVQIATVIALVATLILIMHIVVGTLLVLVDLQAEQAQ